MIFQLGQPFLFFNFALHASCSQPSSFSIFPCFWVASFYLVLHEFVFVYRFYISPTCSSVDIRGLALGDALFLVDFDIFVLQLFNLSSITLAYGVYCFILFLLCFVRISLLFEGIWYFAHM